MTKKTSKLKRPWWGLNSQPTDHHSAIITITVHLRAKSFGKCEWETLKSLQLPSVMLD